MTSTERWLITNFVTGKDEPLPERVCSEEPTPAWVEGWNAGMRGDNENTNPYPDTTLEFQEWRDGWLEAEGD